MAYTYSNKKGQKYILHEKEVTLRGNNRKQRIFYFSREQKDGALDAIPDGYQVVETASSGLPVLKKKGK
jgi:hypothetical protein